MKTTVTRHGSLILLFLSTLAIVSSSRAYAQATVATDFPDYSPGDTVVVTGTGWMSGETVALRFDEDPMWHEARVLYAFADSSGDIRATYGIEDNDLGARFTLTAEGQTSGETAVVLFTDSPKVGSASITAQSGNVCAGTGTATYTVTVNRGSGGGSNGAFTATLSVTSALPAGVTASFSPNPVSFTSGANSGTSTLTLTASGSTPAGTTSIDVKAATSASDFATTTGSLFVGAPPTISCPSNLTINNAAGQCGATATFAATATGSPAPTVTYSKASGSFFSVGSTTVTVTATNSCGTTSCNFTVTVQDVEKPAISVANLTRNTDAGQCTASIASLGATAADNCGMGTLNGVRSDAAALSSPFPKGTTTITWTATDIHGNSSTATETVTVNDTEKPTISAPAALNLTTGPTATQCGLVISDATLGTATANDNCGVTVTRSGVPAGNLFPVGTTTVTYLATDTSGNTASATQTVTVTDNTPPTIATANLSFSTDAGTCAAAVSSFGTTAADNCGSATLTASRSDGASMTDSFPKGTTTITWTATDSHGNTSTATQTVAVADHENPTITTADMTLSTDPGKCTTLITSLGTSATDNCGTPTLTATRSDGAAMTDPFPKGMTTITWLATDASGNSAARTQKITINDTEKPTIAAPVALSLTTGPTATQCGLVISDATLGTATANDNCGVTVERTGVPAGNLFPVGTTTLTYTATDASGNTATATQTITVTDNTPPTITTANLSFSTDAGKCTAVVSSLGTTATDNCGSATLAGSRSDGAAMADPFPKGMTTITWTATDSHGNSSTATQTVAVADHENPTITAPAALNLATGTTATECGLVISDATLGSATANDNCGVTVERTGVPAGNLFPVGTTTLTYTATDPSGNTASATQAVTVTDNTPPAITTTNLSFSTDAGKCTAEVTALGTTATDNCSVETLTGTRSDGEALASAFSKGTTTITWTATDIHGNTSTATQTVTVADHENPTITTADMTLSTDPGKCNALIASLGTSAADNCATPTLTATRSDGAAMTDPFPKGMTTITWLATDASGNTDTATQKITVNDTEKPTIAAPVALSLATGPTATQCGLVISDATVGTPTANDNCGVTVERTGVPAGNLFPVGTTTLTYTATDPSGNTASSTQTVTVTDNTPPTITTANLSFSTDAGKCTVEVTALGTTATDNCSVESLAGARSDGEALASAFPKGTTTITWTATDIHGNTSTATQTVAVADHENPTITTADMTLSTDPGKCNALIASLGTSAADNCGTPTLTATRSDGAALTDPFPKGMTTIAWLATDASGNTATATQKVTINDTEKPTIAAPTALSLTTGPTVTQCGLVISDATLGTATANDNCGVTVERTGVPAGNLFPVGTTTLTYTATDPSGNTASSTQAVTVTDNTPPTITTTNLSFSTDAGKCTASVSSLGTTATDNCGTATLASARSDGGAITDAFPKGTTTITWTATDSHGNTSTATQTVTVNDTEKPTITAPPALSLGTGPGATQCGLALSDAALGTVIANDNCSVTVTRSGVPSGNLFPTGMTTITYTATDASGNTASATQTITITDTTPPVLTVPAQVSAMTGASATLCGVVIGDAALGAASATDNCSAIVTRTGVPAGNLFPTGTTTVTYTAKDPAGNMSTGTQLVIVTDNTPPKITTANLTMPTTAGLCTAAPASLGTTASDNCGTPTLVGSRSDGAALTAPFPKGTTTIVWSAKDGAGNTSNASQTITVTNGMPTATITAPASGTILAAGSTVTFAGTFSDDAGDVHTAKWICDTQSYPATVNESAKTVGGSVTLSTAGVYMIQLVVTDQCGNQVTTTQINGLTAMAVIYDPNAGFVTGGGWIQSPPGAYVPNPSVTGKANFGFVSKYKKGQSTPTGETEFQFKEGDMDFHSASYDWLVVSGAKAQFKGTGTINGAGDYGFLLSAVDGQTSGGGGTDKFRIKITNRVTGLLVYDNQLGAADTVTASTAVGGGSIAIQSGGGNLSSAQLAGDMATSAGESMLFQNFPNPFNPETTIQFSLAQAGPATLRIYNIRGTLVRTLLDESLAEGLHEARWNGVDSQGRHVATGVYFARFSSGGHESGIRMLLVK